MDRLISEQAVIDAIATWTKSSEPYDRNGWLIPRYLYDRIKAIPSTEPKTGHWIKQERWDENIDGLNMWGNWRKCSECSHRIQYFDHHNYCPNCGAKMD